MSEDQIPHKAWRLEDNPKIPEEWRTVIAEIRRGQEGKEASGD